MTATELAGRVYDDIKQVRQDHGVRHGELPNLILMVGSDIFEALVAGLGPIWFNAAGTVLFGVPIVVVSGNFTSVWRVVIDTGRGGQLE